MRGDPVLSIADVVAVLRRVEDARSLTPRQVRYLDAQGVVTPSGRPTDGTNEARLYTLADVAALRLVLRVSRVFDGPAWAVRAALLYQPEIRQALAQPRPKGVVGVRFTSVRLYDSEARARADGALDRVLLSELTAGLRGAVRRLRRERPDVWDGRRLVPARQA